MWIMIIKELPTIISPPKLSIFWSTPSLLEEKVLKQFNQYIEIDKNFYYDGQGNMLDNKSLKQKIIAYMKTQNLFFYDNFGKVPNEALVRSIQYKDKNIRVYGHEYSILKHDEMALYIGIFDPNVASHDLIPETVLDTVLFNNVLNGIMKDYYEAALLDGCSHEMAIAVTFGVDINNTYTGLVSFPPIGWYRCREKFVKLFS